MPPPVASHAPTVASPAGAPALPISAGGGQHQVVVKYYRRMKPNRVYRLVVELRSLAKKGTPSTAPAGDAVKVKPQIPGCFISPAELELGPKGAASKITFYVTPLAQGRLRDAQVGVYHQGRMLQDVRLRMKSVTQRLTRWLLLLTIAAPLFVWWSTSYLNLSSLAASEKQPAALEKKKDEKAKTPNDPALAADMPEAKEPAAEGEPKKPNTPVKRSGGALAQVIIKNVPKGEYQGKDYTRQAALEVQKGYDIMHDMQRNNHLSFWVFVGFLALTVLSLVTHRQARGKRKGKPLALPSAATTPDFGGSDALSFNIPVQPMR